MGKHVVFLRPLGLRLLRVLREWLGGFENLYTVGRNGQHRYNNQDHSMLAGLYAARNVAGESRDLWSINREETFHEEVRREDAARRGVAGRLAPRRVGTDIESLLQDAFAHYDPVAMGGAVGITASLGLAVATSALLLGPDTNFVPMLSLLGEYFFGYEVSWAGLLIGMVEAGGLGFGLGWVGAWLINHLVSAFERDLERRLAALTTLEALGGAISGKE